MISSQPSADRVRAAAEHLGVDAAQYAAHIKLLSPDEAEREVARALTGDKPKYVDRNILYGEHLGYLVFIPESRARDLAEVVDAWWNSSTWGQFRSRLESRGLADEFLVPFDYPDGYPPDDEPLTDRQKDQYTGDGDWPAWPAAEMLGWVPKDIAGMGDAGVSIVSGPALFFDPGQEHELVAAFERSGFQCRRDDDLVQAAHALT